MSDNTAIEWTHRPGTVPATWNPTTGCDKISPGCGLPRFPGDKTGGCYALAMAKRLKAMGSAKYQTDGDPRTSGPGFGVTVHPDTLDEPFGWRKPRTVFVNSMSDLHHARIPAEFIARVYAVMAQTPQHVYQILTKRPDRAQTLLSSVEFLEAVQVAIDDMHDDPDDQHIGDGWPLSNVWQGTSIELDKYAWRADSLRATPAAVRFISAEPLLGPLPSLDLTGIDWLLLGGESGPTANTREMDLGWVRDLITQCRETGTVPFVKQLGSVWGRTNGADPKGGNWDEWPADLRVRQYPQPRAEVGQQLAVSPC